MWNRLIALACLALFSGCAEKRHLQTAAPLPRPSPITTTAPTPIPEPTNVHLSPLAQGRVDRVCRSRITDNAINGRYYVSCNFGEVFMLSPYGRILSSTKVDMAGVNAIIPVGSDTIAVDGWISGAVTRANLIFLRARTLSRLSGPFQDHTFLGVLGNRAFLDDWCCNGGRSTYTPATIFSISLDDGSSAPSVDLSPERELHPEGEERPAQGFRNYMIGHYFYVVVGGTTYRYDLTHVTASPTRMATAGTLLE